jgi:uncharacterized membrane protein
MTRFQRSGGQIALFILSLIGIAVAIYLTIVHYNNHVALVCSSKGPINCEQVLSSVYAIVPGTSIPTSVAGICWSVVGAVLAATAWLVWPEKRIVRIAELLWAVIGMATVFYLVYAELVVLHAICAWCTVVHVTVVLYLLISAFLLYAPGDEEYDDTEREQLAVDQKPEAIETE